MCIYITSASSNINITTLKTSDKWYINRYSIQAVVPSIILRTWNGRSIFRANRSAAWSSSAFSKLANFCSSNTSRSCSCATRAFLSSVTSLQITSNESLPPLMMCFSSLATIQEDITYVFITISIVWQNILARVDQI